MPLLEAFVDENQLMRYKLTTLPKETNKLPILELPSPSLTFNGAGITQAVTPNTRNAPNETYTFTLFNADVANISLTGGGNVRKEQDFINAGATTPVFMNEAERKRSISVVGKSVRVISRSLTTLTNTNLSVTGNSSGAQFTVAISVKADPSKV